MNASFLFLWHVFSALLSSVRDIDRVTAPFFSVYLFIAWLERRMDGASINGRLVLVFVFFSAGKRCTTSKTYGK